MLGHLGVLLVLQVLVDGGVEVLSVALVQAVDFSSGFDGHAPLSQDELADGLRNETRHDQRSEVDTSSEESH